MLDEMDARDKVDMQIHNDASLLECLTTIKLFILINSFIVFERNNQACMERTRRGID